MEGLGNDQLLIIWLYGKVEVLITKVITFIDMYREYEYIYCDLF